MASIWAVPLAAVGLPALGLLLDWSFALAAVGAVVVVVVGIFAAVPRVPLTGPARWLTFGGGALLGTLAGAGVLGLLGSLDVARLLALAGACAAAMGILSIDAAGTTPWYPGNVNGLGNRYGIDVVPERCMGAAECVQVCPRDVLVMDGPRRRVTIARPDECIRCGACIVQCPDDALRFRFDDGRVIEPATVRRTRVNMLGRRTVEVEAGPSR